MRDHEYIPKRETATMLSLVGILMVPFILDGWRIDVEYLGEIALFVVGFIAFGLSIYCFHEHSEAKKAGEPTPTHDTHQGFSWLSESDADIDNEE